jgi:glucosamine--fructose-6-phosphate aminotransferase (isomerizing)
VASSQQQPARTSFPSSLRGLKKLEYRGYDSAGLAVISGAGIERVRSVGRVAELEIGSANTQSVTGIAHTRWATHGVPSERNAHPHVSGSIAVVHNGIIENYESLRRDLTAQGYVFTSDTDTESIAHLLEATLKREPDLFKAVQITCRQLVGAYAIAVIDHSQPGKVVVAREGSPLLLGVSDTGNYAASDASALLQVTRNMVYLENGDIAELTATSVKITRLDGTPVERPVHVSQLSAAAVELGNYQHYMQKEIFEQPEALANTLEIVGGSKTIQPGIFGAEAANLLADVDSHPDPCLRHQQPLRLHRPLLARSHCRRDLQRRNRQRIPLPHLSRQPAPAHRRHLAIRRNRRHAGRLRHAKSLGQMKTLAICNVPESAIVRECALRFITRAGPEIGVASTKAFTTQLAALFLLTLVMAKVKERLTPVQESAYIDQLRHLPVAVNKVLELEPTSKSGPSALPTSTTPCSSAVAGITRSPWKAR